MSSLPLASISGEATCQRCGSVLAEDRPGLLFPRCVLAGAVGLRAPTEEPTVTVPKDEQSGVAEFPDPLEGSEVGNYKILQRIGEGGFGVVYMAAQTGAVHRRVALKIIKPGMDSRQVIARFEAERQVLAMMDHANIARVFDAGTTEQGRPYFVMELVKGIPLSQFCREENLDIRARLDLFIQVCRAVQHAHLKGIIHRDLKPSNVLVTLHDGEAVPKVIDFGIAKAMDRELTEKTLFTRYEQMIGTPAYMSPEQAALSGLDVDTRSDVYSLGVLLYEILTGTTPFDAETLREAAFDEMRRIIREEEPPRPSARLTALRTGQRAGRTTAAAPLPVLQVGRDLDWIVMKALEKDRGRRYDTAGGLARDVERFLADQPVEAGPPGLRYKLSKFLRRHWLPVAAAGVVVLALVAGVILAGLGFLRASAAEEAARKDADTATAMSKVAAEATAKAREEARTATEAREVAAAMNEFLLEDLLGQAGPYESSDQDVTLRTVLERASQKLGERFEGRPLVEAEMRMKLGEVYETLSVGDEAETHFARGAELYEAELGPEAAETLRAWHGAARQGRGVGLVVLTPAIAQENREKISTMTEILAVQRRVLGAEHPDTLATMGSLAQHLVARYDYEGAGLSRNVVWVREAIDYARPVVAARVRNLGPGHPDTCKARLALAAYLSKLGEFFEAEAEVRAVLEVLDGDSPRKLFLKTRALEQMGSLCRRQGDRRGALRYWSEGLSLSEATLGRDHSRTVWLISALSGVMKRADARALLEEKIPGYLTPVDRADRQAKILSSLINKLAGRGYFAEAARYALQAAPGLVAQQVALAPDFYGNACTYALMAGDAQLYAEICREFLNEFGETEDPGIAQKLALQILLNPAGQDQVRIGCDLAKRAITGQPENPWAQIAAALGMCRKAEFGPLLRWANSKLGAIGPTGPFVDVNVKLVDRVIVVALASLAHQALGHTEEARGKYREAATLTELAMALGNHHVTFGSWMIAGIVLNEAEAALEGRAVLLSDNARLWMWHEEAAEVPEEAIALIEPPSEWKYLHRADGTVPAALEPGFFTEFIKRDYDDSHWATGSDAAEAPYGFGYGDPVAVELETPEKGKRSSAYFRHRFSTEEACDGLWLGLICDDGVIIYLDGEEVGRFAIAKGVQDRHGLTTYRKLAIPTTEENEFRHFKLDLRLEAGEHVLAISLHNSGPNSSDLRLGRVHPFGLPAKDNE